MTNRFRIELKTPAQKAVAERLFNRKIHGRSFFATAGAAWEFFRELKVKGLFIRSEERAWVPLKGARA
jgi:hypothetical protein